MRSALVIAALGLVAVFAGIAVTMGVFRFIDASDRHADDAHAEQPQGERSQVAHTMESAASALRGGAWIGALERAAIFAGLIAGWPETIAIVLAVKGLGRYPELKSGEQPAVAERFIIGTFVSVLWACGCAGVAHWLTT
ncbi:hypothetical protein [Rudaeicoccus suwonensis]|uniref:Uncharacterized protein n=1 Tax=Rudaeicoccus suwonensis TaxID=657409 RepID=A0A561EB21_9MICO|nr:hypothetical protein [Rudaeicoccus suwonensis]TWE12802.1 hypothetical protein BKA23_1620 [Rudaeicoccus suwonensis]